jgi:hypothetical protein
MTRTGLTEWPAHQFGGSTFVTEGRACAAQTAAAQHENNRASRRRVREVFKVLMLIAKKHRLQ